MANEQRAVLNALRHQPVRPFVDIATARAVAADGSPYPLPEVVLSRGARRVALLGGDDQLVMLKGDISHKEVWVRNLTSGRERQLTALGRAFTIRDCDISPDGRELLIDCACVHRRLWVEDRRVAERKLSRVHMLRVLVQQESEIGGRLVCRSYRQQYRMLVVWNRQRPV